MYSTHQIVKTHLGEKTVSYYIKDYWQQFLVNQGPSWSSSYGSWIYNYICDQHLPPLTLDVRIPLEQGVLDTTVCDKVCQ
jgi:hypothetical protein